jgi:hypothetical protein
VARGRRNLFLARPFGERIIRQRSVAT